MAYKAFLAPTGSGNTVFEGSVINGYTSPDGKTVHLQFFSNDRGYSGALYRTDLQGCRGLYQELQALLKARSEGESRFESESENGNFRLAREKEKGPLVLACHGTDPLQGRSYHRGDAEAMAALLKEFEQVLGTIEETAGKQQTKE